MFLANTNIHNKTAIVCNNGNYISYEKLEEITKDFSENISGRSLLFLLGSNNLSTIVCYLASIEVGVVPLLLSESINTVHLAQMIETYSPKYIFANNSLLIDDYEFKTKFKEGFLFKKSNYDCKNFLHRDLALLLTTSGSTGSPKLVKLTKRNILSNAKSISKYLDIDLNDRAITSLPFNYSYGLSVINSHLLSGASIILSNSSMIEKKFWSEVNEYSATSIAGVPYNYEIMLRLGLDNLNIPTINKMTQAGGKLAYSKAKKINNKLKAKGIDFYTMYGQTEATARISYLPCDSIDSKPDSIGIAIPGGRLWIEDEENNIISKENVTGELVYKGDNVSMGYAESLEDLNKPDINNGVLKTGDLACFDEDGYFFIKGRKNRFVKVFGNRISLDSVEKIVENIGFECVVTGKDDLININILKEPNLSVADTRKKVSEIIGINMIAINVFLIEDLPRLDSGKINYKLLS